jgi:hypothetical protein
MTQANLTTILKQYPPIAEKRFDIESPSVLNTVALKQAMKHVKTSMLTLD